MYRFHHLWPTHSKIWKKENTYSKGSYLENVKKILVLRNHVREKKKKILVLRNHVR